MVCPKVIEQHVWQKLPFLATENIITAMIKAGSNQQDYQQKLRVLANRQLPWLRRKEAPRVDLGEYLLQPYSLRVGTFGGPLLFQWPSTQAGP